MISHVLMNYYDELNNQYRTITRDDIKNFITVSDYLGTIDGNWMCTLMPDYGKLYTFYEYEIAIRNTTKPVCVSSFEPDCHSSYA